MLSLDPFSPIPDCLGAHVGERDATKLRSVKSVHWAAGKLLQGSCLDHSVNRRTLRTEIFCPHPCPKDGLREIPPGLLQHVLTVLVFWSWVLLLPRHPPWSRSLRLFPWASILLYGPLDIACICCPQLPHRPCKNGTHSTCFYSTGRHTPMGGCQNKPENAENLRFRVWCIFGCVLAPASMIGWELNFKEHLKALLTFSLLN